MPEEPVFHPYQRAIVTIKLHERHKKLKPILLHCEDYYFKQTLYT